MRDESWIAEFPGLRDLSAEDRTFLADDRGELQATHQHLATELGSAREVVSRQIKAFSNQGLLASTRGHIQVLDRQALQALMSGS